MIPALIKMISVNKNETEEKRRGMLTLISICFNGETGIILTNKRALFSLLIEREAEALMTPEKRRINVRLIPLTNSGKYAA